MGITVLYGWIVKKSVIHICVLQARSKLSQIQDNQQEVSKSIEKYNNTLNGTHGGSMTNLADMSEGFSDRENGGFPALVRAAQVSIYVETFTFTSNIRWWCIWDLISSSWHH